MPFAIEMLKRAPRAQLNHLIVDDHDVDQHLFSDCDFYVGAAKEVDIEFDSFTRPALPVTMIFNPDLVTPPTSAEEMLAHRYVVAWPKRYQHGSASPHLSNYCRNLGLIERALKERGLGTRNIAFCTPDKDRIAAALHQLPLIFTGFPGSLPEGFAGLAHAPVPIETLPLQMGMRWHRDRVRNPLSRLAIELMQEVLESEISDDPATWRTTPYQPR